VAVVAGALCPGCNSCQPTPPPASVPSGCWTPAGTGDGSACATASDIEPNDTTSQASELGVIPCSGLHLDGSIAGDVDMLHISGPRCAGSQPGLSVATSDSGLRTCLFVSCQTGKAGLGGCSPSVSTQAEHLPEGMRGCCRLGAGDVAVDANCDSDFTKAAGIPLGHQAGWYGWVVVDRYSSNASATTCGGYAVDVHF
jgi:hypothetical protein